MSCQPHKDQGAGGHLLMDLGNPLRKLEGVGDGGRQEGKAHCWGC